MGDAYNNAVITTSREELGSEFGPDLKPFEGITTTVTVNGAGPKGGISGPLHQFRPIWKELTGGDINIVELPFAEHYTKMMLDLRNGTGEYDAFMVGAFWYGDIAPAGYAYAIDERMASGKYPKWTYDDMPPSLKTLHQWEGVSSRRPSTPPAGPLPGWQKPPPSRSPRETISFACAFLPLRRSHVRCVAILAKPIMRILIPTSKPRWKGSEEYALDRSTLYASVIGLARAREPRGGPGDFDRTQRRPPRTGSARDSNLGRLAAS